MNYVLIGETHLQFDINFSEGKSKQLRKISLYVGISGKIEIKGRIHKFG